MITKQDMAVLYRRVEDMRRRRIATIMAFVGVSLLGFLIGYSIVDNIKEKNYEQPVHKNVA